MLLLWAILSGVLLARLVWHGVRAGPGPPLGVPIRIDPSTASIAELMCLPGMGRGRAAAVVLYRVRHGPFRSVAGLAAVDGIGPAMVERWRPFLRRPGSEGWHDNAGSRR